MKQAAEALTRVCRYACELIASQPAWLMLLAVLAAAMRYVQVSCPVGPNNLQVSGGACFAAGGVALLLPLLLPLAYAYFDGVLQVFWVRVGGRRGSLGKAAFLTESPRWWEDFGVMLGVGLSLLLISLLLAVLPHLLPARAAAAAVKIVLAALSLYVAPALAESRGFREALGRFWGGLLSGERAAAWVTLRFWALALVTPLFAWLEQYLSGLLFHVGTGRLLAGHWPQPGVAYYVYVAAFGLVQVSLNVAVLVVIYRYFWLSDGGDGGRTGLE